MTRAQQLERYLFQVKTALIRQTGMHPATLLDGLAHCLTSNNVAVVHEAARILAEQHETGNEINKGDK
jgi:hypothetical protein